MTRITPRLTSLLTIWLRLIPNFCNCVIHHNCTHETLLSGRHRPRLLLLLLKQHTFHDRFHDDVILLSFPALAGCNLLPSETELLFRFLQKSSLYNLFFISSAISFISFSPLLIRKLLYCYLN